MIGNLININNINKSQQNMSWRNPSYTIKSNDSESINQISKLRLENTRYRIELENIKRQMQPRIQQILKLEQEIEKYKDKQNKAKNYVMRIGVILNCSQVSRSDGVIDALDAVEKKIVEIRDKMINMQKQAQKHQKGFGDGFISVEKVQAKQKQIQLLRKINQQKEQQHRQQSQRHSIIVNKLEQLQKQLQRKDNMLGELSHKLTQCEIQKKDLEVQISTNKNSSQSIQIKKQFEQLLNQISIKDDDYLKSYLLKNQRFQNSSNSISRRNKYDFIFQE